MVIHFRRMMTFATAAMLSILLIDKTGNAEPMLNVNIPASSRGENGQTCVANGKPCVFPFKDSAGTSYSDCANFKDKFFYCATSLQPDGKFKGWEKCPEDGTCPLFGSEASTKVLSTTASTTQMSTTESVDSSCLANKKPCIFPFKDSDETSYSECANYKDKYFWCATSLDSNGKFKGWEKCPEDGTCPLFGSEAYTTVLSTTASTTVMSTSTTVSTTSSQSQVCITKPIVPKQKPKPTGPSKECIFPFKLGKVKYNSCIKDKKHGNRYFCATSVKNGIMKKFGYCEDSCPKTCMTTGASGTGKHLPCKFPFILNNQLHKECTIDDKKHKKPICATSTKKNQLKKWGVCDTGCPVEQSTSTTVDVKDGDNSFSCKLNLVYETSSGFKLSNLHSSCLSKSTSSQKEPLKNLDEHRFDFTTSSGVKINCRMNIVVQDKTSGIAVCDDAVKKSLNCSVDESLCVTTSGDTFPAACILPFTHEGRTYQACTDKGGRDPDKLWCATGVDESGVMTSWGYCSTACGYCGGKDASLAETRSIAECGYDCLINPYKRMEPKTTAMNPRLLSAPGVSYFTDSMTYWNRLPYGQYQFLQGDSGLFLNCSNGFNHFPCQPSIYINCTGDYRFNVYSAQMNDGTAKIGDLIKTGVKNTHIGCGPCPMGFDYKAGDELVTYEASLGRFSQVPNIGVCKDLCDRVECPTFVYSAEKEVCELHSKRVDTPSYPVYRDYHLCTRQTENSCGSSSGCDLTRSLGTCEKNKLIEKECGCKCGSTTCPQHHRCHIENQYTPWATYKCKCNYKAKEKNICPKQDSCVDPELAYKWDYSWDTSSSAFILKNHECRQDIENCKCLGICEVAKTDKPRVKTECKCGEDICGKGDRCWKGKDLTFPASHKMMCAHEYLKVSSKGGAATAQSSNMGIYKLTDKYRNNFPVWKREYYNQEGEGASHYLFVNSDKVWSFGADLDTNIVQIYNTKLDPTPLSPHLKNGWKYYDDGWKTDNSIRVEVVSEQLCNTEWLTAYQGIPSAFASVINPALTANPGKPEVTDWRYWPWTADLHIKKPSGLLKCGGTLISCQHILTAKTCVWDKASGKVNGADIEIRMHYSSYDGKTKISKFTGQKIYIGDEDIALIKMDRPISPELDLDIRPILLPDRRLAMPYTGDYWVTDFRETGTTFFWQTKTVKPVPSSYCKELPNFNTNKHICLGKDSIVTETNKISHGPGNPGMIKENGEWFLEGVHTSRKYVVDQNSPADAIWDLGYGGELIIQVDVYHYKYALLAWMAE